MTTEVMEKHRGMMPHPPLIMTAVTSAMAVAKEATKEMLTMTVETIVLKATYVTIAHHPIPPLARTMSMYAARTTHAALHVPPQQPLGLAIAIPAKELREEEEDSRKQPHLSQ